MPKLNFRIKCWQNSEKWHKQIICSIYYAGYTMADLNWSDMLYSLYSIDYVFRRLDFGNLYGQSYGVEFCWLSLLSLHKRFHLRSFRIFHPKLSDKLYWCELYNFVLYTLYQRLKHNLRSLKPDEINFCRHALISKWDLAWRYWLVYFKPWTKRGIVVHKTNRWFMTTTSALMMTCEILQADYKCWPSVACDMQHV